MNQNNFNELFKFNKRDRNGILFLSFLIVLAIGFNISINYFGKDSPDVDFSSFYELDEKLKEEQEEAYEETEVETAQEVVLFSFNPNTIGLEGLKKLGLNNFQAGNLIKYREKGGIFYNPVDIKKIYGFDEKLFQKLKPFIKIENRKAKELDLISYEKEEMEIATIDLNGATEIEFYSIPVVKNNMAKRIIKYRDLLGGFYSHDQLYEVYGIDSNTVKSIMLISYIDTSKINRIDINNADYGSLIRNPYMEKYQVDAIMSYRKLKKFKNPDELLQFKILDNKTFMKMIYYIDIQ